MGRIRDDNGQKRKIISTILFNLSILITTLFLVHFWLKYKPDLVIELIQKHNSLIAGLVVQTITISLVLLLIVELTILFIKFKQFKLLKEYIGLLFFASLILFFMMGYRLTSHYAEANFWGNMQAREHIIHMITDKQNTLQQINTNVYKVDNQDISATKYIVTDGDHQDLFVIFYVVDSCFVTRVCIYASATETENDIVRTINEKFHYHLASVERIEENWYIAKLKN